MRYALETLCFRRSFSSSLGITGGSLGARFPRSAGISIIFQTKTLPSFFRALASILPWRCAGAFKPSAKGPSHDPIAEVHRVVTVRKARASKTRRAGPPVSSGLMIVSKWKSYSSCMCSPGTASAVKLAAHAKSDTRDHRNDRRPDALGLHVGPQLRSVPPVGRPGPGRNAGSWPRQEILRRHEVQVLGMRRES